MVAEDPLMKKYKILNKNYRDKNNNTSLQIAVKKKFDKYGQIFPE